ncbi:uncharacterized protein EDB93DRAFT_1252789 [Suillus bovinus]|uniref:uncharacterized protein n=1 Tax=Suillus bovinus TaxID=48563 RepID=UPI001B861D3B|nr:uncharacterized protein EDB93DRAFT_1252789 [Suillus bovinus]KAG2140503.1 hypothetical protein EDB93DRAFT_1252789 [Suillus bovinus]
MISTTQEEASAMLYGFDSDTHTFNLWLDQHCKGVQQVKGSPSAFAASRIVQVGIATIIVLEYSAFLANSIGRTKHIESAVDYYLKSPTAVAVEKGAEEISRQGYDKEELEKKVFEFILENRLSKDLTEKK